MLVPMPKTPLYLSYSQQFSSGAAYLFAGMRCHIFKSVDHVEPELPPVTCSPWDRLVASTPADSYHIPIVTTEGFLRRRGALISILLELAPRFSKYRPTRYDKWFGVHGCYPSIRIGFNDKQPLCFISATEAASSTFRHPCSVTVLSPMIPTILVTDIDGPQPSGTYCCLDESYKAMSSGGGLLWREWKGRFSPSRNQCGGELGDQTYFEGAPPARVDKEEYYTTRHIVLGEKTCQSLGDLAQISNPVLGGTSRPGELEWWETEEGDDEDDSLEGESDSDLEDEEDDDDDDDDDEADSEFSGSEDGDDEYEDDSEDDSGEDSDLEEESEEQPTDNGAPTVTNHDPPPPKAPAMPSHQPKSRFLTQVQTGAPDLCQDIQDLEESHDPRVSPLSSSPSSPYLSVVDSDFESYNSSTTMSSLSPTPITPASPFLAPFDISVLQKCKRGPCDGNMTQLPETPWSLVAPLDLELGSVRRAKWELEDEVSLVQGTVVRGALSIEGLDLAGWSRQGS